MSEKQDRYGARTAADLERKYSFGKTFAEILGIANDARNSVDKVYSELSNEIKNQVTAIYRDTEKIILSALADYVKTTEYEEYKKSSASEFEVMADQISMGVTSTTEQITNVSSSLQDVSDEVDALEDAQTRFRETVSSELSLMADRLALSFNSAMEQISNVDGEVQSVREELEKHFIFSTDGLTIKAGENAMNLVLDNDIISFQKNGKQFGWWDGVNFHTGNIVVNVNERAQFGNFAFVPRSNGSLDFLKVGG